VIFYNLGVLILPTVNFTRAVKYVVSILGLGCVISSYFSVDFYSLRQGEVQRRLSYLHEIAYGKYVVSSGK